MKNSPGRSGEGVTIGHLTGMEGGRQGWREIMCSNEVSCSGIWGMRKQARAFLFVFIFFEYGLPWKKSQISLRNSTVLLLSSKCIHSVTSNIHLLGQAVSADSYWLLSAPRLPIKTSFPRPLCPLDIQVTKLWLSHWDLQEKHSTSHWGGKPLQLSCPLVWNTEVIAGPEAIHEEQSV